MERSKGLTGSTLKLIAMVTMLIDHIAAVLMVRVYLGGGLSAEFYNVILLMRIIGRPAFPIFCFLLVEGFQRTRDVKKYVLRMVLFALVSEIPYDLSLTSQVMCWGYQNVMFTMTIGLLAMCGLKWIEEKEMEKWKSLLLKGFVVAAAAGLAALCKTDYSWYGILCICILYLLKIGNAGKMLLSSAVLTAASGLEIAAVVTAPLVRAYNGERGLKLKYFFYAFYPVHLLLLYLICVLLGLGSLSTVPY